MYECTFKLNSKPMSAFRIIGGQSFKIVGGLSFPAFSGKGEHTNRMVSSCLASVGPIPLGTYYIFDRGSGLLGQLPLYSVFNERSKWFALYAVDGKIDDEAYCNRVKRGEFRLHPKGERGISKGCITVESSRDYSRLREILKSATPTEVPGSTLLAYGKVTVYY